VADLKARYASIRLILGDQLNAAHSWFSHKDQDTLYVLAELKQEQTYVLHHIQKICAFFKAMQSFAAALESAGHHVRYLTLDDTSEFTDLPQLLLSLCQQYQCTRLEFQRPDEYRLLQQFGTLKERFAQNGASQIEIAEADTEHFLLPYSELGQYFKTGKHVRMENFYRAMRKRFDILMEGDHPLGGQWNYDEQNRQAFKSHDLQDIPAPLLFSNRVDDILARLKKHQIQHFGQAISDLPWPCTRKQALQLLDFFCSHCLPNFGRFQDAMTGQSPHAWSLFHSRLSFALNSKMLHPMQVIDRVIETYHAHPDAISLAQVEGFVRQILGWREYVRGMYWVNMPEVAQRNHLQATKSLPDWFWTGKTRMNCLSQAIGQSLSHAYAHHIQRLMITGNFALLTGLHPDEVDAWYLGIYIDALEWVELPNTRGMALFADGGLIATKPYAASGNYISKMSDYCSSCHYQVKQKTGEGACPFNSFYWHFIARHKETFMQNSRMAFPYKTWLKMPSEQQDAILNQADIYLENLNHL
jgi:deoxyribodipyrimidine photolyase-related protein